MLFAQTLISILAASAAVNVTTNSTSPEHDITPALEPISKENAQVSDLEQPPKSKEVITKNSSANTNVDAILKPETLAGEEIQEIVADRSHEYGLDVPASPYPGPKIPPPPPLPAHYDTLDKGIGHHEDHSSHGSSIEDFDYQKTKVDDHGGHKDHENKAHTEKHDYGHKESHSSEHKKEDISHDKASDHSNHGHKDHEKKQNHNLGYREYSHTHYYEKEEDFDQGYNDKDGAHDKYKSDKGSNQHKSHKGYHHDGGSTHGGKHGYQEQGHSNSHGSQSDEGKGSSESVHKDEGHYNSKNGYKKGRKRVKGYIITTNREYFNKGSKSDKGHKGYGSEDHHHDKGHKSHDSGHSNHDSETYKHDLSQGHKDTGSQSYSGHSKDHVKNHGSKHSEYGSHDHVGSKHPDYESHDHGGYESEKFDDHLPRPSRDGPPQGHKDTSSQSYSGHSKDHGSKHPEYGSHDHGGSKHPDYESHDHGGYESEKFDDHLPKPSEDGPPKVSVKEAYPPSPDIKPSNNGYGHEKDTYDDHPSVYVEHRPRKPPPPPRRKLPRPPKRGPHIGMTEIDGPRSFPRKRFRGRGKHGGGHPAQDYPRRGPLLRLKYNSHNPKIEPRWSPQILAKHK